MPPRKPLNAKRLKGNNTDVPPNAMQDAVSGQVVLPLLLYNISERVLIAPSAISHRLFLSFIEFLGSKSFLESSCIGRD